MFRTTYKTDKTIITGDVSLSWSETPVCRYSSLVNYIPEVYNVEFSEAKIYSRSLSPQIKGYFNTKLNERQSLDGQVSFKYGRNKYRRQYEEGGSYNSRANSDVSERTYGYDARLKYMASFNHNNSISLLLWSVYSESDTKYAGSSPLNQKLSSFDLLFYPTYTQKFNRKFLVSVQTGFDFNVYRITGYGSVTRIWPRPALTLNYTVGKKNSVYFRTSMGTTVPLLYLFIYNSLIYKQ